MTGPNEIGSITSCKASMYLQTICNVISKSLVFSNWHNIWSSPTLYTIHRDANVHLKYVQKHRYTQYQSAHDAIFKTLGERWVLQQESSVLPQTAIITHSAAFFQLKGEPLSLSFMHEMGADLWRVGGCREAGYLCQWMLWCLHRVCFGKLMPQINTCGSGLNMWGCMVCWKADSGVRHQTQSVLMHKCRHAHCINTKHTQADE